MTANYITGTGLFYMISFHYKNYIHMSTPVVTHAAHF